jgi:phosphate transport system substrate-binding protein
MKETTNMKRIPKLVFLFSLALLMACVQKVETMVGPTMGRLEIVADENMKNIVMQEEEIFERTYKYAHLDIRYTNEFDLFESFLRDSIRTIMATRPLSPEEKSYFNEQKSYPRETQFATGAIAFIKNRKAIDTTVVYEELMQRFTNETSGDVFVLENAKSGITQELLRLMHKEQLPKHFYALNTKQEVLDYVQTHDNAVGIVDYSDISDSDSAFTKEVLRKIHLLGISRPADSTQVGFVQPYQYNLVDNKYPFTRDLYFISKTGKEDVGNGICFLYLR